MVGSLPTNRWSIRWIDCCRVRSENATRVLSPSQLSGNAAPKNPGNVPHSVSETLRNGPPLTGFVVRFWRLKAFTESRKSGSSPRISPPGL